MRREGVAYCDEELEIGVRMAIPLRGHDGDICYALSMSTSSARTTLQEMERRYLPILRQQAICFEELFKEAPSGALRVNRLLQMLEDHFWHQGFPNSRRGACLRPVNNTKTDMEMPMTKARALNLILDLGCIVAGTWPSGIVDPSHEFAYANNR